MNEDEMGVQDQQTLPATQPQDVAQSTQTMGNTPPAAPAPQVQQPQEPVVQPQIEQQPQQVQTTSGEQAIDPDIAHVGSADELLSSGLERMKGNAVTFLGSFLEPDDPLYRFAMNYGAQKHKLAERIHTRDIGGWEGAIRDPGNALIASGQNLIQGFPVMAATLGAGAVNPLAGAAVAFADTSGDYIADQDLNHKNRALAYGMAAPTAIAEVAGLKHGLGLLPKGPLTKMAGTGLIKTLGSDAVKTAEGGLIKQGIKGGVKIAKHGGVEGATEAGQQMLGNIAVNQTTEGATEGVEDAALLGGFSAVNVHGAKVAIKAPKHVITKAKERVTRTNSFLNKNGKSYTDLPDESKDLIHQAHDSQSEVETINSALKDPDISEESKQELRNKRQSVMENSGASIQLKVLQDFQDAGVPLTDAIGSATFNTDLDMSNGREHHVGELLGISPKKSKKAAGTQHRSTMGLQGITGIAEEGLAGNPTNRLETGKLRAKEVIEKYRGNMHETINKLEASSSELYRRLSMMERQNQDSPGTHPQEAINNLRRQRGMMENTIRESRSVLGGLDNARNKRATIGSSLAHTARQISSRMSEFGLDQEGTDFYNDAHAWLSATKIAEAQFPGIWDASTPNYAKNAGKGVSAAAAVASNGTSLIFTDAVPVWNRIKQAGNIKRTNKKLTKVLNQAKKAGIPEGDIPPPPPPPTEAPKTTKESRQLVQDQLSALQAAQKAAEDVVNSETATEEQKAAAQSTIDLAKSGIKEQKANIEKVEEVLKEAEAEQKAEEAPKRDTKDSQDLAKTGIKQKKAPVEEAPVEEAPKKAPEEAPKRNTKESQDLAKTGIKQKKAPVEEAPVEEAPKKVPEEAPKRDTTASKEMAKSKATPKREAPKAPLSPIDRAYADGVRVAQAKTRSVLKDNIEKAGLTNDPEAQAIIEQFGDKFDEKGGKAALKELVARRKVEAGVNAKAAADFISKGDTTSDAAIEAQADTLWSHVGEIVAKHGLEPSVLEDIKDRFPEKTDITRKGKVESIVKEIQKRAQEEAVVAEKKAKAAEAEVEKARKAAEKAEAATKEAAVQEAAAKEVSKKVDALNKEIKSRIKEINEKEGKAFQTRKEAIDSAERDFKDVSNKADRLEKNVKALENTKTPDEIVKLREDAKANVEIAKKALEKAKHEANVDYVRTLMDEHELTPEQIKRIESVEDFDNKVFSDARAKTVTSQIFSFSEKNLKAQEKASKATIQEDAKKTASKAKEAAKKAADEAREKVKVAEAKAKVAKTEADNLAKVVSKGNQDVVSAIKSLKTELVEAQKASSKTDAKAVADLVKSMNDTNVEAITQTLREALRSFDKEAITRVEKVAKEMKESGKYKAEADEMVRAAKAFGEVADDITRRKAEGMDKFVSFPDGEGKANGLIFRSDMNKLQKQMGQAHTAYMGGLGKDLQGMALGYVRDGQAMWNSEADYKAAAGMKQGALSSATKAPKTDAKADAALDKLLNEPKPEAKGIEGTTAEPVITEKSPAPEPKGVLDLVEEEPKEAPVEVASVKPTKVTPQQAEDKGNNFAIGIVNGDDETIYAYAKTEEEAEDKLKKLAAKGVKGLAIGTFVAGGLISFAASAGQGDDVDLTSDAGRTALANSAKLIKDPKERAAFLAQIMHESRGKPRSENLRYSEKAITKYFSKARLQGKSPKELAKNPEALANTVYGGEWGRKNLGNTEPGDGYRFRGRGYFQITGRENYRRMSEKLGVDLVKNPELANQPGIALAIAKEYWNSRVKPRVSDFGNVRAVTKAVNGGDHGLAQRTAQYKDFLGRIGK